MVETDEPRFVVRRRFNEWAVVDRTGSKRSVRYPTEKAANKAAAWENTPHKVYAITWYVEVEVAAAVERAETRKRFGVHFLPDAEPVDPSHARALAHARGLRAELEKMKLVLPGNQQANLAGVYGRLLDAVLAAVEEHALGFYFEQVTTPPRMVLRNDGAVIMDTTR